ncbi:MAG TPA: hypothetical protein VFA49_02490 [Chloroflexota bacterium]|nr:hypothetical protein [Chloroflexota bacterium]
MRHPVRFFAAVALAALAFAAPALAESQPANQTPQVTTRTRQIHGNVKTTSSSSFVVTTDRYGDVTVDLPSGGLSLPPGLARHHSEGRSHLAISASELHVGDRVVIQGRGDTNHHFLARRIHLLHHAKAQHVVGTFKSFAGSTLTVTVNGTDRSFTVNSNTVVRPADKSLSSLSGTPTVTVVSRDGTTATAVHIHS